MKKKTKIPHVYLILLMFIVVCGILTYVVPSGTFERVEVDGVTMVDPESFHYVEQTPVNPFEWFVAIPQGFVESSDIIVILFLCVGGFGMFTSNGALQKFFNLIAKKSSTKSTILIMCALMSFFYIRGGLTGAVDSPIAFVPLVMAFAVAAGFDVMTGVAMVAACSLVGFSLGPTNPFSVVVAQGIAELPIYSGVEYRTACWILFMVITYVYIIYKAQKVKRNPHLSLTLDVDVTDIIGSGEETEPMTKRDKLVVAAMVIMIAAIVVCSVVLKLSMLEVCALYIIGGIIGGLIAGYDNHQIAGVFVQQGKGVFFGAMCIAMARAIPVILTDGNIIDTIIFNVANLVRELPPSINAAGMFIVQTFINFFINSGSGQAAATMPLMTPLADLVGVSRQTAVLAFQLGDGLSNLIWPTSGNMLAMIACGKVEYGKWLRYIMPLFLLLSLAGIILLMAATAIGYQ